MTTYPPYTIYKNIKDYFESRKVVTEDKFDLSIEDFIKNFQLYGFHRIMGSDTRRANRKVVMVIIASGTNADSKVTQFKKVLNLVVGAKTDPVEITFVTNKVFTSFIKDAIEEEKTTRPFLTIQQHDYVIYSIVIPKHTLVPFHQILTEDQLKYFLNFYHRQKSSLQRMKITDPMAIWLGASPGEVIMILRESEATGRSIGLRLVK